MKLVEKMQILQALLLKNLTQLVWGEAQEFASLASSRVTLLVAVAAAGTALKPIGLARGQ